MPDNTKVEAKPITQSDGRVTFEIWMTVEKESGELNVTRLAENVRPSDCTSQIAECERQLQSKRDEIASLLKSIGMWEDLKAQIAAQEA